MKEDTHNWNVIIRKMAANKLALTDKIKACLLCGYDRCVDVCHIKQVSKFTATDKLSAINDISNIVYLCPNHHRELDSGILSDAEVGKVTETAYESLPIAA